MFSLPYSLAQWDQISIESATNDYSFYSFSPCFNDLFTKQGDYIIRYGRGDSYKKHSVKSVEILDEQGTVHYACQIDTSGRLIKEGRQLGKVFFETQTIEISKEEYLHIRTYSQHGSVIRIDSIQNYHKEYKNKDTSFYYSVESRVSYWKGHMINSRNRYLNENYWNKEIKRHEGDLNTVIPSFTFNEDGTISESDVYYHEPFKSDYDSLTLYKTDRIRYASGYHHYVGQNELDPVVIKTHPFFKPSLNQTINEHYVDGASFIEPQFTQERMWCGNSLNYINYDNGRRYGYTLNDAGLRDTFYVDFYQIDTSTVTEPKPSFTNKDSMEIVIETVTLGMPYSEKQPRRVSTPVRSPKLFYHYTYYAKSEE